MRQLLGERPLILWLN